MPSSKSIKPMLRRPTGWLGSNADCSPDGGGLSPVLVKEAGVFVGLLLGVAWGVGV